MYEEWMDAVPLFINGCPRHNIRQLKRAIEYHKRYGNNDIVNTLKKQINEELLEI